MTTSTSILFIDAAVTDIEALLAGVDPGTEIVRLSADRDGLAQIAEALAGRSELGALHIVSHGDAGMLQLGSTRIDQAGLDARAAELATIRGALAAGADLLLYGCQVAEGAAGRDFISALAEATGADVAASEDITGAASRGGNWSLEATTGAIEAQALQAEGYAQTLSTDSQLPSGLQGSGPWNWGGYNFQTKYNGEITNDDPDNPLRAGNKWDRYVLDGVAAGTRVYVYMGNSGELDDFLQIDRNGSIITQNDDGADGERSYDAFVSWIYQPGDVIRATTYASHYRGSYSLYIGTSTGVAAQPTDIGNNPPPPVPTPTAPTFTDSHGLIGSYADTGAADSFANTTGTFTATDSTPTSTLRFSGGGTHAYGTLAVSADGNFVFTPDAAKINTLAAGQTASATFTVSVSDGSLSSSKTITVNVSGANDAPTLASNASLPAIAEDAADPAGANVASLFAPRFADVDVGASFGGIVVVGDASTPAQGAWEYSTDGGATWQAIGAVSADAGLALSASTRLRFVPAANWDGTPGALTVHATDDDYAGGYTSGATRVPVDTTNDAADSGVSDAPRALTTFVIAVNDTPTFNDPTPIGISLSETAAADAAATLDAGALSGTLSASDVELDALSFGIRGGTASGANVVKSGVFGTLTVDSATGNWSYQPTNLAGLNALPQGAVATDSFELKVVDAHGAQSVKTLTVTLTGTNDQPLLAAGIADQVAAGAGAWRFQIPANAFNDAEGLAMSYTVQVVDALGTVIDTITTADGVGSAPSDWLSFDAASRTLTGTPPDASALPLTFKVTATDSGGLAVSDTFVLTLDATGSGSNTAVDAAPLSSNDRVSLAAHTPQALALSDFGNYTDADGTPLAAVKITSLPSGATLEYSADGISWTAVTLNQTISAADIALGHLRATSGGDATTLGFQVSDGANFSPSYQLALEVAQSAAGVTFADAAVSSAHANTWTNVYDSNALTGFTGTVRVMVDVTGGGTVKLSSAASGVDAVTVGYGNLYNGTATSIAFEGTLAEVNTALQLLQANRGNGANVSLDINVIAGGATYNPANQHYYEVVGNGSSDYTWEQARMTASAMGFNGLTGYLATITSAEENAFLLSKLPADAWIGASDADAEGVWKWVTGPEAGQVFSMGNGSPVPVNGQYANWNSGEPNDSNDEDYAQFYASSGTNPGRWNDLTGGTALKYFIVEYGGGGGTATQQASRTITLGTAEPSLSVAGTASYLENALPQRLDPALVLADPQGTLASATVTIVSGWQAGDRLAFANDGLTMGTIAGSYNPATGVLTLSAGGGVTLAQWQAALKAVTFASTSDVPGASRTISWQVNDGVAASNVGSSTVSITAVNDAPTATHLQDQSVTAGAAFNFNIGSPFVDAEGDTISYSASLADGSPLPAWLNFDAATHVFSGNPPAGVASLDIRVSGSDGSNASSTSFTLHLADPTLASSAANNAGTLGTISGTPTQGQTLTAPAPTDADGYSSAVSYQWQVSSDNGATWRDIAGARGQGATLDLAESEAGQQVRVQAFYNDAGGTAEMPVSNALSIANVDDAGSVAINGVLTPGETLVATVSDADGLGNAAPSYQWFRDGVAISGANYSSYTLGNDDGGKTMRVDVSYTDDQGTVENRSGTSASTVQLGVIAPVAADDSASATEASGVANAIPGTDASGNLLANDSDANNNIHTTTPITAVRAGGAEGVGDAGTLAAGVFTIAGQYGTLTVNQASGAYSYVVNQAHDAVQALQTGQTLQDAFNYTLADLTGLADTGALTITINGANDAPTLTDLPPVAVFTEDVAAAIRSSFSLVDPDGGASFALRLTVTQGTVRGETTAAIAGVTVTGHDTGVLTIAGPSVGAVQSWLSANQLLYTSAPNENGNLNATLTWAVQDGAAPFIDAGTTALNVSQANNAPIVDAGGAGTAGNDFTTTFRPRGAEVAVVANDLRITDIDPADTLQSATVSISGGAFDNAFGTLYETLRSTAGTRYTGSLGDIVITGSGTAQLVFTGAGTHADYEAALKTVLYGNSNPNAFSGDRSITISVSDADGQASNAGSFATAAPNTDIAVGQRIFVNGQDSGFTVGQVIDSQHFVASGPLTALAPQATLDFWGAGALVTSAVQAGPIAATTTVQVPWTPVIDMSGEALAGRDHAVSYTEGQAGVAIARPDASITDQDGNIASVVVTLTNAQNGGAETLFIDAALQTQLTALGIHVAGSGTQQITLSGNKDATFFQIGLRGVKYANGSDHPEVATARIVSVTSTDVDGNTGVGAQTVINLVAVNDAPTGTDTTLVGAEDTAQVLSLADFGFVDVDGNSFVSLTVTTVPASGTLTLDGTAVSAGLAISAADIAAGKLVYTPAANVSGAGAASFQFQVQDDGGTAHGGVAFDASANTLTFDLAPSNDAPVLTAAAPQLASIGEDDLANAGQRVSDLVGGGAGTTGVADVDTMNNGGAGHAPEGVGRGIAVHTLANHGPATGGAWEYSVDGGSTWLAVGAVSEASALLLGANDRIRFVPDGENATRASFSYVLWDGASGTAGTQADATTRGGASAFSTASDTATIAVTPVNDAATVDLNGAGAGSDFATTFRPRGDGVAVVGDDITIADVDRLDAATPDTLVSATVALTGGALDNLFGTTYETLHSSAGNSFAGSLGALAITGNGTGDHGLVDATELHFSGAGTRADYEAALKTVIYDNANPNAYSGDRTVQITVRDASVSTGDGAHGLDSAVATTTIEVPWTPVVDMNGDLAAGRDHSVSYTEHSTGVAIAAPDASIVDQNGNIHTVTVTLTNPLNGAAEKLFVSPALVTQLGLVGITVLGNDSHAITLLGNRDGTSFQLALRAIQYLNGSHAADLTPRVVTIAAVDQDGNSGVDATTTIHLVGINDAPEGIDSAVTLAEDGSHSFALADFGHSDAEGNALVSVTITTLPASGTLTLDGVAVAAGDEITVADIAAGKLVFTPAADANGTPSTSFSFQLRDDGGTANGGVTLDATPNTLALNVTPVNDAPTGSVAITGSAREGGLLTAVPAITDVDRSASEIAAATTYQWQVRSVPGGTWTDVAGANAATFVPTAAERYLEVRVLATYTDVSSPLATVVYDSAIAGQPTLIGDTHGELALVVGGNEPVVLWHPEGDVTVTHGGTGPLTVEGLPGGGTLTVDGTGDTTLSNPLGNVTVGNAGPGTVTVTPLVDDAAVTTTGTGPTLITQPAGDLTLNNGGSGLVTVRDLDPGQTVVVQGTGPVAVESDLAAGERITVDTSGNSNVQLNNLGAGVIDVLGGLTLDGDDALSLTLNGPGITELSVAGAVSLTGTPLHLRLDEGYAPTRGDVITLIENDGSDAITGHFAGLPEGAPVYVDGQLFSISYVGGTGNDVVLTRINDGPTGGVSVSGTVAQGQTLTASHSLADSDGLGSVRYQWLADGALLAVGASYVVGQEAVGRAITVVADYTDAQGTVETVTSAATAPVTNVNDAPTGQVLVAGSAVLGQTLVASHTLADADGLGTVSYQWRADGQDIAGATGSSLVMGSGEVGRAITVVATYTDALGASEQVSSAVVLDGNGVPSSVEAQAPALGSGGLVGDGNGDGLLDTLQPSVVSAALDRPGDAPSTFVTLVVDSVDGKVREGSTDRLMDFTPTQAPSDLPSWAELPAGEIGFAAAVDGAGVTKNFSLYVDKDLGVNGYWSRNADGLLVNLASEAYGGRVVQEGDKLRLDFQITEGGEFDHGAAGDTSIVNHGAAGHASLSLIGFVVDAPVNPDGMNLWD